MHQLYSYPNCCLFGEILLFANHHQPLKHEIFYLTFLDPSILKDYFTDPALRSSIR